MTRILKLLFIGFAIVATACSELPGYELPYELSPVSDLSMEANVTPANAICPASTVIFTVDSESTVYYVVQPQEDEALTSDDIYDDGDDIDFSAAGSEEVEIPGLELGESYTVYAVTVNVNGIRSDEVTTTSFTMPTFSEVVDEALVSDYRGTVTRNGAVRAEFDVTLTNDGDYVFSAPTLWGNAISGLTGNPAYDGSFQYPGTITLSEDFSLVVESTASSSLGGEGDFDPCDGTFTYTLATSLFDNPATEAVETVTVNVELVPAE